jgi:hypothetical protein
MTELAQSNKFPTKNSITPSYRFTTRNGDGNQFMARPIAHWRKQLHSATPSSTRRMSVGMPMDLPGGSIILETHNIQCETCNGSMNLTTEISNDSPCKLCIPTKQKIPLIDSSLCFINTDNYFNARCITYLQNTSTLKDPDVTYFTAGGIPINPSDSENGTQKRKSTNCFNTNCNNSIIYKPNNTQYAQQGGVSSSSRLSRLKYNTLNNYGAAFNSASGATGMNRGRYQTEPSPSYQTNLKPQRVVFPRKSGASNYCPSYTICMYE